MRRIIFLALILALCQSTTAQTTKDTTTMAKVTGIGGVFFKCKDPAKMKQWYKDNLGIESDAYGHTFKWYEEKNSNKVGRTVWSPFPDKTDYFGDSGQQMMLNYRVNNIEQLVKDLQAKGVKIVDKIESYEGIGKFVHILDAEGNRIELWEPVEERD
jgi:predicted enzyme related to lactoylglutathione lyase